MCQKPDTADKITQGQNILIHSVTRDLPLRMMGMMDEKAPPRISTIQHTHQSTKRNADLSDKQRHVT